jgi:hypothetical protein
MINDYILFYFEYFFINTFLSDLKCEHTLLLLDNQRGKRRQTGKKCRSKEPCYLRTRVTSKEGKALRSY